MFWKREKKVRVEFASPITVSYANCAAPHVPPTPVPNSKGVDKDFALKLLFGFAIFLQAALIVYGYLELTAYYEQFGIETSELELGTPTILASGYLYAFTSLMSLVDRIPFIGPLMPWFPFVAVALTYAYLLANSEANTTPIIEKGIVGGVFLFLLFIAPVLGVQHGIDRGRQDIKSTTGIDVSNGIGKEHSVVTKDGGRITGHLLVADTKSMFLLSKDIVYKIDNRTSRVMRQTLLKAKAMKDLKSEP